MENKSLKKTGKSLRENRVKRGKWEESKTV